VGGERRPGERERIPFHPAPPVGRVADSSAGTEVAEGPAIDESKAAQERIAYWLATYREALGRFSIGRIWPTAASFQVNRDAALKELDLAKRSGDAVLIDPQGISSSCCGRTQRRRKPPAGGWWRC